MTKKVFNYADKMAELQSVLAELQQAEVSLDEALKLHEKGTALLAELDVFLKTAEIEVRKRTIKE